MLEGCRSEVTGEVKFETFTYSLTMSKVLDELVNIFGKIIARLHNFVAVRHNNELYLGKVRVTLELVNSSLKSASLW